MVFCSLGAVRREPPLDSRGNPAEDGISKPIPAHQLCSAVAQSVEGTSSTGRAASRELAGRWFKSTPRNQSPLRRHRVGGIFNHLSLERAVLPINFLRIFIIFIRKPVKNKIFEDSL